MQRNISLDFFRGVMAIFVALGHFFHWNGQIIWNNPHSKMPFSFILAVDFFLILSGFVISASVFTKEDFNTYQFIQKRYYRLLPVYLFCVVIDLFQQYILSEVKPNSLEIIRILAIGEMLPTNHLQLENYLGTYFISYTISAEFWVGIILFPLVFIIRKYIIQLLLPLLIMISLFSLLKITNDSPHFMSLHYQMAYSLIPFGIIRCLLDYSLGIIAYIIYEQQTINNKQQPINDRQKSRNYWNATILQILILMSVSLLYGKFNYNRVNEFVFPFICMVFIISLAHRKGAVFDWFNNKVGEFFGNISYPMYLIHPIFIHILQWNFIDFNYINSFYYIAICIITSFFIHKFIEKPYMVYFFKRFK